MSVVVTIVALSVLLAQAPPAPPGLHIWKSNEVLAKGKSLAKKLDAQKVATETVATEGNRRFLLAHREGSGLAEVHDKEADIIVISAGEITMVYGGTVVDGKTTQPGEIRGPSIQGGTEMKLGAGDMLHIPAKLPHQMKLEPGKQVTYFVAKIVE